MALDLGTISGVIGLDSSPLDKGLDRAIGALKKWAGDAAKEGEKGGEEGGRKFAEGWGKRSLVLLATGGSAVATAFTAAVVKGMNLEPAHDKVAATLGLSVEEADRASKAAGALYSSNWGDSMEDAADRTGIILSSLQDLRGQSAEEIARMTGLFSAFSDGFEVDMARASQVAGQMVKTGMAKDAEEAVDLLTVAFQRVPAAVRQDVLDATDEYGPFFEQLGISGETAMTMLVDASEKGMFGIDKTGDALKEFTIRATDMSTTTGAAYETLGLNQLNMTNELLAGGDRAEAAFAKIMEGLTGIQDPAKQSQAALALFGTPLEDLGTSEIPQFISMLSNMGGGLGDVAGATQRMGDTMSNSASANISAFLRTLEAGATEAIGGQVLPALNEVTGVLVRDWGPVFSEASVQMAEFGRWVQDNANWLGPLATGVTVFGAALAGLGLIGYISSLGGMSAALAALAGQMGITTAATYAKQAALLVADGASKAYTAAQWLMNAALTANPIGLIVLALAALVGGLILAYQNSEEFRNIVDGALRAVQEGAQAVVDWFQNDFLGFWTGVFDGAGEAIDGFASGADQAMRDAQKWVDDQAKAAEESLNAFASGADQAMKDAGTWVTDRAKELGQGVLDGMENARQWGQEKLDALASGASRTWDGMKAAYSFWSGAFGKLLSGDFEGFRKDVETAMSSMKDAVLRIFDGLQTGAKRIWDMLPDGLKEPIRGAVRWINDTFVGGINGMLGKLNISFRIPTIPGFADGGYTGSGGKYVPAGIVHAGEVVFSQEDVAAWGGPAAVDTMRRARGAAQEDIAGFAGGGIVPNATQGFNGYNESFLQRIKAWAEASGRTWYMTGLGGARTREQQALLYQRYLAGGNLAAPPWGNGPHIIVPGRGAIAMDINPHPNGAALALMRNFGLGLTVRGEPWHVGNAGGSLAGGVTDGGGGGVNFAVDLLAPIRAAINAASDLVTSRLGNSALARLLAATPKVVGNAAIEHLSDMFNVPGYVDGTTSAAPGLAWVGERGPELVRFRGGEQVIPGGWSGMPSELVVVDSDGQLIGRMKVEARRVVHETVSTARGL